MRKYPAQFETCQDLSPYIFPHQILSSLLSLNLLHFLNPNICEKKFKIAEEGVRKLSAISKTSHRDVLTDNSPRQGSKWNSYHIPSRAKSRRRGVKKTEVRGSGGWEKGIHYQDVEKMYPIIKTKLWFTISIHVFAGAVIMEENSQLLNEILWKLYFLY